MTATSNFDPAIFPQPEKFDPTRDNLDKAMTFGIGVHYCLGHAIAKLIAQTSLLAVVNRYPVLKAIKGPTREYNMVSRRIGTFVVRGEKM